MTALNVIPIHSSLNRPNLILGAERELMLTLILLCSGLAFVVLTPITITLAIILWIGGSLALRSMAKADAIMSKIYKRHILYVEYYPARSTPFRINKQ